MAAPGTDAAEAAPPIGVTIGSIGESARWWLDSARRLDAAGYRAIWTWDHFVSRGRDRTMPVLEAMTLLAAAAATTERALLGPFVLNATARHPAIVARMVATLDGLAPGRLRLGLGIGGQAAEHEAYGIDFPASAVRVARLREAVTVMRALWSGGPVDVEGRFFRLRDAYAFPRPVTPPPILIGAQSPGGVRLAAEIGDGWAAEGDDLETLLPAWLEALERAGRPRSGQTVVVGFGGGRSGRSELVGSPFVEAPREAVAEWLERGADEVTVTARTTEDVDALVRAVDRW